MSQTMSQPTKHLFETQKQERYRGYDPTYKIRLTWGDGEGVCEGSKFWRTSDSFLFNRILMHGGRLSCAAGCVRRVTSENNEPSGAGLIQQANQCLRGKGVVSVPEQLLPAE